MQYYTHYCKDFPFFFFYQFLVKEDVYAVYFNVYHIKNYLG